MAEAAVRDLNEELEALNGVLRSLTDTIRIASDIDFSALDYPLQRCGNACKEFWADTYEGFFVIRWYSGELSSMGVRQMLAGYKSTIIIALTDAQLRKSSVSDENIQEYKDMIQTTTVDLEARMEVIDGRIDAILKRTVVKSDTDDAELEWIKEERLGTQKCLEICAQVSKYINEAQLRAKQRDPGSAVRIGPERITLEGLQECTDTIGLTTTRLEMRMQNLIDRVVTRSKAAMTSGEEAAELARLQEDWESARHCIDICSKADRNITIVENYAEADDAIQFVISTSGKTVHGKNRGLGLRTRQVGGHLSDESLQQISRDMVRIALHGTEGNGLSS